MIFLHCLHAVASFLEGADAVDSGFCAANGGHDRRAGVDGGGADLHFVRARHFA